MNNTFLKVSLISCSVLALAACGGGGGNGTSDSNGLELFFTGPGTFDSSQPISAGEVDLSTYVAVGDSLTAGFADGSLYFDGQINSFPNILAQSFAQAGGGSINQPLVNDNLGGLVLGGSPIAIPPSAISPGSADGFESRLVLSSATSPPSPIRQPGTRTTDLAGAGLVNADGPFNNLGVPGARVFQLSAAAFGALPGGNPFYGRFASNPGTSTVIGDAASQAPTFFTLWIGNNDVLDFATSGGVVEANDGAEATGGGTGAGQITQPAVFGPSYTGLVTQLTSGGANGVLVNIPAIQDIPFFTTVPFNPITLPNTDIPFTVAQLNAGAATYNAAVEAARQAATITDAEAAARTITFVAGSNAPIIVDEALPVIGGLQVRQATANDAILLTTLSSLGAQGLSVAAPLTDAQVLTEREIGLISVATAGYNSTIEGLAAANPDLVVYDAAADLASVNQGILLSSTSNLSSSFISGGGFSLDGVHPTATGYSVVANGILRTMNLEFGANLPFDDSQQRTRVFFEFPAGTDFSAP